jgi:hypothetical protein
MNRPWRCVPDALPEDADADLVEAFLTTSRVPVAVAVSA